MSKHDLAARPIYHHKRASIEAHLTIVFAALVRQRALVPEPQPPPRRPAIHPPKPRPGRGAREDGVRRARRLPLGGGPPGLVDPRVRPPRPPLPHRPDQRRRATPDGRGPD